MKKYINISVVALLLFGLGCIKQQINPVVDKKIKEDTSKPISDPNIPKKIPEQAKDSTLRGSCGCSILYNGVDTTSHLRCIERYKITPYDTASNANSLPVTFYLRQFISFDSLVKTNWIDFNANITNNPISNRLNVCDSVCINQRLPILMTFDQSKYNDWYTKLSNKSTIDSLDLSLYNLIFIYTYGDVGRLNTRISCFMFTELEKIKVIKNNTLKTFEINFYYKCTSKYYNTGCLAGPVYNGRYNIYKIPKIDNGYNVVINQFTNYNINEINEPGYDYLGFYEGFNGTIKDVLYQFNK
ncbi:MAG: hypothetical protein EAZ53_05300 [Bacteroidetes bacterium]|nr:MAG: hypothetical protein EAZ53_05300 [Bacteroidota bacterium]